MALDWGASRTGIALCDPTRTLVRGWGTLDTRDKNFLNKILEVIEFERVNELVIGLPLRTQGEPGTHEREIKNFSEALSAASHLPLHFQDEAYSSSRAQALMRETGMKSKKRRQKSQVDRIAACIILQDWLDSFS